MKKLFLLIFILAGLYVLTVNLKEETQPVLSEDYSVIDSGLWSDGRSINWMDNHRIISYGIDPEISSKGKIYIWDINKQQIKEYSNGGPPCYYNGYIYYPFKVKLNVTKENPYGENWKEGLIGNENLYTKVYDDEEGTIWQYEYTRNKFDCKLNKRPEEMENHIWVPLVEEHGYLDFGEFGFDLDDPVDVFLVAPDKKRKQLKFTKNQVGLNSGIYTPFKNAYFFWPHVIDVESRKQWEINGCLYGWWLDPSSGNTHSECIPYTSWTSSPDVIPTREGLFMTNYNYKGQDPHTSGGYLKLNKGFVKVITGEITHARVSPDGCSIAMAHRLTYYANKNEKMTLKVVNICK